MLILGAEGAASRKCPRFRGAAFLAGALAWSCRARAKCLSTAAELKLGAPCWGTAARTPALKGKVNAC